MNISKPFAPEPRPIPAVSTEAFTKAWETGHPDLPWSHQMRITGILKFMSEHFGKMLFDSPTSHITKTFSGDMYDMYMRLYSLYVDAFIVRGNKQFMPRIVVFSDIHPRAMDALLYIEKLGRVRIVKYYRMPFEPIDKARLRSLVTPNTVLISAPYVNCYGRKMTRDEVRDIDVIGRECGKTPLHIDITYAFGAMIDAADTNNRDLAVAAAPIVTCDLSYSLYPHSYIIAMHNEHIINQPSNQMHAFMELRENHCSVVAIYSMIVAAGAVTGGGDPAPVFNSDDMLTDLRIAAPDAYFALFENVYKSGWPKGRTGMIVITKSPLSFVMRIGDDIVRAKNIQARLLESKTYIHIVDAREHVRDRDDPTGEAKKIMAQVCVVTRPSRHLQELLVCLLCDSTQARLLCAA